MKNISWSLYMSTCPLLFQGPSLVTALCIFTASLVCSPALLCILILLKTYRYSCHLYLKLNAAGAGERYMGLLEGPDSFWTSDETISNGVINILALADFRGKGLCAKLFFHGLLIKTLKKNRRHSNLLV